MDPKRVKSYNQIKMCMCMDVWGIYMVTNLILLCSLKTYLSLFGIWKQLSREHGLSYSFFSLLFFRRAYEYPLFWISQTFVHFSNSFLLFHSFFMNNFCIATCLFYATKLLRDNNKNLEHLFGGYSIGYNFSVHSQCRSKIFLGDLDRMACFCAYSQCRSSAYVGGVYVILILRA
jgi:hypothetical protein